MWIDAEHSLVMHRVPHEVFLQEKPKSAEPVSGS